MHTFLKVKIKITPTPLINVLSYIILTISKTKSFLASWDKTKLHNVAHVFLGACEKVSACQATSYLPMD